MAVINNKWCDYQIGKDQSTIKCHAWFKLDLQLLIQSVPINTKVVSSNPVHGEVYLIQHYVIKFDSDLHQ
jgi:hypothetical protein